LRPSFTTGSKNTKASRSRARLGTRQTDSSKARIEIRLKNEGEERSYLTSAVFTVRKLLRVAPCGIGAGIVVGGHYDVVLPRKASKDQTVELPINQQVAPDGVARFVFRVGRRFSNADTGRMFVYQLDVAVRHDGADDPTEVGRVLLLLPGSPAMDELNFDLPPTQRGCVQDTLDSFREAAQLEGIRSLQFERTLTAAKAAS